MSLITFLGWQVSITIETLWMSVTAFRFHKRNLCSEDEWRSYGVGTTWGWV